MGSEEAPRKSYAQMLAASNPPPAVTIEVKSPAFTDLGEPAVYFSKEEIERSVIPFKNAIIAKCSYGRSSIPEIKSCLSQRLMLSKDFIISTLNPRHLLFRFDDGEDFLKVLLRRSLYIKGYLFRFFRWDPTFDYSYDPTYIPVWIGLPLLPVNFYHEGFLKSIAGNFGTVLQIHDVTKSMTQTKEALVSVELDIKKTRPDRIWIGCDNDGFWQKTKQQDSVNRSNSLPDAHQHKVHVGPADPVISSPQPVHGILSGGNLHADLAGASSSRGLVVKSVDEEELLLRVAREDFLMPDMEINREASTNVDRERCLGGSGRGSPRTGLYCFYSSACCSVLSDGLCSLVVGVVHSGEGSSQDRPLSLLAEVLPRSAMHSFRATVELPL
ncbi:hypothetical protein Taro_027373 [Colocasia esculenta]|uniref:DUF4283 domain-containing protein n=1 Tax=Colocasia esculenta TaxID=4460 RepID=A0A843VFJ6_COLES|nr:hypothetical protein [Colocasia esculenta]